ncbi:MAG: ROK family protein [Myxococcaceae bacterium]|nr:ROK family protein [Myxococcaceae bacterium]
MMQIDSKGEAVSERTRTATPRPATPEAVWQCLKKLFRMQAGYDRVSVGFPGVIQSGIVRTAPNLDGDWVGFPLQSEVEKLTHKPARVANDADIQGYGLVSGKGFEMVITLGTGMGAALFMNGVLIPNLELGHHPFRGEKTYEQCLGKKALEKHGVKKWNKYLHEAIVLLSAIFNFDRLYIGGGNAENVSFELPPNVILAHNIAGLTGGVKLWENQAL